MATERVTPPSAKKRLLRGVFKLCRSISKLLPHDHKPKMEDELKVHTFKEPQEPEVEAEDEEEGVSLCTVRSYRYDGKKPSLSRSCSQKVVTPTILRTLTRRSLSSLGRKSKTSNKTDDVNPEIIRSNSRFQRSFTNPILYSSSSVNVAKPLPTEQELSCTLEELCKGCTKKIKIKRDVITSSGQMSQEEETVEIKVKPGWRGGTKVTFEGKGDEAMGSVPADLTFVIVEKEHEVFRREGDDLKMTIEVSLVEALTGCEFSVDLPDGENIYLKIEDVIHTEYVTLLEGKGMLNPKEKGKKGDLRISYLIKLPEKLTDDQRVEIQRILEESTYNL